MKKRDGHRMAWMRGGWIVALLAILLAACGSQATPVPLLFDAAPWQSGEQHSFALTDVDGKPAGTANFMISAGVDDAGERLWVIERTVDAQGDQETIRVKVEESGFRPHSSYLERSSVGGTESVDAQYRGSDVDMTLYSKQNIMSVQRMQIPSDARDTATLPMLVRALPLAKGYATELNSFLPIVGLLDRVTVRVTGEEDVTAPVGTYKTWVVEIDMGDSKSKAWVAQVAPFPLIKYVDGRNKGTFELSEFKPKE